MTDISQVTDPGHAETSFGRLPFGPVTIMAIYRLSKILLRLNIPPVLAILILIFFTDATNNLTHLPYSGNGAGLFH